MRQVFRVPYTPNYFETNVSPGQIINPLKYWARYKRGRRNPVHVGKINGKGEVEVIK